MIVCHCTGITDHQLRAAIGWMRAADPDTIITPRKIYRALGQQPDCGGCMKLFVATMRGADGFAVEAGPAQQVPAVLRGLRAPIAAG